MIPMRRKLAQIRSAGGLSSEMIDKIRGEVDCPLTMDDLKEALKNVSRSVSNDDLSNYQQWMKEFGST